MIPVSTEIEGLIHPLSLRADEYLNEDSLICCSKCHTPRQKRLEVAGTKMEPRCMCACQTADYDKREQERKHREFLNTSTGLLLWGNVGTGKSYIAGCIANALLDKGVPVIMTNFARLLNKLTDMYSGDRNAYIDSFKKYPLMIIDDLGVERNSEFAREQVFSVIDSRYRSQLPMIVTTNLSLEELKDTTDLSKARIYDRVMERCLPIKVNEQNIRELNQAAVLARAKQLLSGT